MKPESVYGKEFLGRTVTLPISFQKLHKKSTETHLYSQTFKELCGQLCYTYTKYEYTNVSNALENLCQ